MSSIYLPSSYTDDTVAEFRQQWNEHIRASVTIEDSVCNEFTRRLQRQVHPDLFMVRARPHVHEGTPLWPGHYHLLKITPGELATVWHIHDGQDGFAVPTDRVFELLSAGDLHDPRTLRRWEREAKQEQADAQRDQELKAEQRRDVLRERVNAATRAQVSMDDTIPWTQNSQARRPKKKDLL